MRTIILCLLVASCAPAAASSCNLTGSQYEVLDYSYYVGKPHNLGYTLAAIALKESNLGQWVVNLSDPSAGDYHVTLNKVIRLKQWENTQFNRNRAASLLIKDRELSSSLALNELLYWQTRLNSWDNAVKAYNEGSNWNSVKAEKYLADIETNIRHIKSCNWIN